LPTLCWFSSSDSSLKIQCAAGTLLSVLVIGGVAPAPALFLLWLIYLSLSTVCREFLGFQWTSCCWQTGFLAIFFCARASAAANGSRRTAIAAGALAAALAALPVDVRSGCVKLLSGESTWRELHRADLSLRNPTVTTWIGWYAHQLPVWAQKASTILMFGIELAVPFLIFRAEAVCATLLRRVCHVQILIMLRQLLLFQFADHRPVLSAAG